MARHNGGILWEVWKRKGHPVTTKDAESSADNLTPAQLTDRRIAELGDWRGELLARIRGIIKATDSGIVEEWKWRGTPTWYHNGIVCTGETYKTHVKITFAKGAALADPEHLFNSSLDGNVRRAIDLYEGDALNEKALAQLLGDAIALNEASAKKQK